MPRNPRPAWRGIGGRHAAESGAGIGRNTHAPQFIDECLRNPTIDCTVMLAFNMQLEGRFTDCGPGEYVNVMSGVYRIVPRR